MKYVNDLHIFGKKLSSLMIDRGMVKENGEPDPILLYNAIYPDAPIILGKRNRSQYNSETRKYANWINGRNNPKTISELLELCNALNCDVDYFFTYMPSTTHDIQYISDVTGLSESSIKRLENSPWFEHVLLDTLLSKGWFLEKICRAIYEYMEIRYKEITFTDSSTNYNKSLSDDEKQAIAEFEATKLFSSLLTDDIANDPKIKELSEHEHLFETIDFDKCSNRFQENLEKAAKDKHMTAKQYTKEFFAKHKNNK